MKKEKKYIAGIDGLRAIAVLMVFAYHLKLAICKWRVSWSNCISGLIRLFDHAQFIAGNRKDKYN